MGEAMLYNVVQFFPNEQSEYVRRAVDVEEAVRAARHYTTSVGARIGTTTRVIVTDMMDCTVFEWIYGKGIVYPTKEMLEDIKAKGV